MRRAALLLILTFAAGPAAAHVMGGSGPPGWTLEPWVVAPLLISAALFGVGLARLRARSAHGREGLKRRAWLFAAGWLALAGAVVSPLHAAGGRSFAAHMLEHELLMLAAAPLLVLSRPLAVMLWAFPSAGRQALAAAARSGWVQSPWSFLSEPVAATSLQAAALWLWHLPSLFNLALGSEAWHAAQHLSFLVTALLFWTAVLDKARRGGLPRAVGCLFLTSLVSGALGAFMALSSSPWYARYAELGLTPEGLLGGLSAAEDQQLAGLLMWVPGGLVHAFAALALLGEALKPATR